MREQDDHDYHGDIVSYGDPYEYRDCDQRQVGITRPLEEILQAFHRPHA